MITQMPEWFEEWVEDTPSGWRLKKEAPDDVKKAYEEYLKDTSMDIEKDTA